MYQPCRCSSKGVDTRQCASKDAGLREGGFGKGSSIMNLFSPKSAVI